MEPGRQFNPPATSVTVQAIYDAESIAFLVKWHDMGADRTGKNDPTLPVPPEEELVTRGAAAGGARVGRRLRRSGSDPDPGGRSGPLCRTGSGGGRHRHQSSPTRFRSRFRRTTPTSARKPYFIFGDAQNSVDLWFFDLARPEPLQFTGRGSADIAANDTGDLTGAASYDQGEWSVIFKRPLRATSGAPFVPGEFLPIGFSVWDGFSRDRGNRRGLTPWYSIYVEPQVVPSAIGPMVRTALLLLVIELAVICWVRWRYGYGTRGELGGEPSHPAATRA